MAAITSTPPTFEFKVACWQNEQLMSVGLFHTKREAKEHFEEILLQNWGSIRLVMSQWDPKVGMGRLILGNIPMITIGV